MLYCAICASVFSATKFHCDLIQARKLMTGNVIAFVWGVDGTEC